MVPAIAIMMLYRGRRKTYVFYEERYFVYYCCESITISTVVDLWFRRLLYCLSQDCYIQLRNIPLSRCQKRPENTQAKVRRPLSALTYPIRDRPKVWPFRPRCDELHWIAWRSCRRVESTSLGGLSCGLAFVYSGR